MEDFVKLVGVDLSFFLLADNLKSYLGKYVLCACINYVSRAFQIALLTVDKCIN